MAYGGIGSKMAGGNPDPSRGRDPDEFYPTPAEVTQALVVRYPMLEGATVWEPCAGDGTMAGTLLDHGASKVVCSDLTPRPPVRAGLQIGVLDVLKVSRLPAVDAIVTNPPFDIAHAIIPHILGLRGDRPPLVALVLKATYWHAVRRHSLFLRFRPSAIHPLLWRPDFKGLGAPTMEIMWCVWNSLNPNHTVYEPLERP